ncbi:TetR/AcrR family transcriptional regulator [Streptosporangium lutulentum]|uniref:AcrR family transcriptional regulator n=1 Tax=Streptosporangium lutulentum TaxID=1461250 RepID=A0ABT9QIC9_9ACTN|nr:TetR/AcrR family transcriptional regulator [Streptosporangium lutulentum]MDP9846511.1 AcrR family transcriptional regulator [Streptosporangium lutulentum]
MTDSPTRRRAPGMSPEQRRAMIVAAALPLVAEYGAAITTSQIARAAGIGEATIFRAFADKEEVLTACLAEAMSPGHVLNELASISLDEPLAVRLAEAAEAMRAHLERMGTVIGTLHAFGHRRQTTEERPASSGRGALMSELRDGVAELIEPDRATLRLDPEKLSSIFLSMLFTQRRRLADDEAPELTPQEIVDVLLHGALNDPGLPR